MRGVSTPLTFTATPATLSSYASSGDISNATLYSHPVLIEHADIYAFQFVLTGATVTGTLKLQASNSNPHINTTGLPDATLMDWTDIDGATYTATVAATPMINAAGAGYRWVRAVWTESGTAAGTMTGRVQTKGAH